MYCCTNSSSSKGVITYPDGNKYSSGYASQHTSGNYAGCIQLYINYNYWSYYSFNYPGTGIYTCTIPDSNNNNIAINFGLYREGFNSKLVVINEAIIIIIMFAGFPSIYQLEHSDPQDDMLTFTCMTQNAPATDIKWFRDDMRLEIDGKNIQMSTRITSRHNSYTNITLKINDTPENITGVYTCQVGNKFGSNDETVEVNGKYNCVILIIAHLIKYFFMYRFTDLLQFF